jgi:phage recombination protein Bet
MSTALALQSLASHTVDMWTDAEKLKEMRKLISPEAPLTDMEFNFLTQLGRATALNPFMKEIWAVKYKQGSPAQIYIGRDGYRKVAQRQNDYEYHQVDAVYSKDDFIVSDGAIHHKYGFANRGELIGAYCVVKRKSSAKPTYVMVSMAEYNQGQSIWKSKPETMIKKVAEAQALRQAFQEALAGTYSDAELPQQSQTVANLNGTTQTERLIDLLKKRDEPTNGNVFELVQEVSTITESQVDVIIALMEAVNLPSERLDKALANYKVDYLTDLTSVQADEFIANLEKLNTKQRSNNDSE